MRELGRAASLPGVDIDTAPTTLILLAPEEFIAFTTALASLW